MSRQRVAELQNHPFPGDGGCFLPLRLAVHPTWEKSSGGRGGGTHRCCSGVGETPVLGPPSPGIWALFPQQTCPPLSCQAKYFGWRERRREPRFPVNQSRWVWGGKRGWARPLRAALGDIAAARPAGAGEASARRDPGDSPPESPARPQRPHLLSSACSRASAPSPRG